MTTKKQYRANRANAKKSTGPKSKAGKARAARNAIKHGVFSDILFMEGEDQAAFQMLCDGLHSDFQPKTHLEAILVDQLVMTVWRMRRLALAEAAEIKSLALADAFRTSGSDRTAEADKRTEAHAEAGTLELSRQILIGRYQTMLINQIEKTQRQIFELSEKERSGVWTIDHPAANDTTADPSCFAPSIASTGSIGADDFEVDVDPFEGLS